MKKEDYMLDAYEKHLLENGSAPSYGKTTKEQRERDLAELLTTLPNKEEKNGNQNQ